MIVLLLITIVFGFGFLGNQGASSITSTGSTTNFPDRTSTSRPATRQHPATDAQHTEIYFSLYWAMTGLHALHMIIGIGLVTWIIIAGMRGRIYSSVLQPGGKCRACIGTLSTWSGFIYSRCSI